MPDELAANPNKSANPTWFEGGHFYKRTDGIGDPLAEVLGAKAHALMGLPTVVPEHHTHPELGEVLRSKRVEGKPLGLATWADMEHVKPEGLAAHLLGHWVTQADDRHGGNYLLDPKTGMVRAIDFGVTWHPRASNGPREEETPDFADWHGLDLTGNAPFQALALLTRRKLGLPESPGNNEDWQVFDRVQDAARDTEIPHHVIAGAKKLVPVLAKFAKQVGDRYGTEAGGEGKKAAQELVRRVSALPKSPGRFTIRDLIALNREIRAGR